MQDEEMNFPEGGEDDTLSEPGNDGDDEKTEDEDTEEEL